MAFEEFQKRAESERRTETVGPWQTLMLLSPGIAAVLVTAVGGTRLLMEFLPLWFSILIAALAAILACVVLVGSRKDIMDFWVASAVIIILVLMLVPAVLKTMHKSKAAPRQAAPAAVQEPR